MWKLAKLLALGIGVWLAGCSKSTPESTQPATGAAKAHGAYRIYVMLVNSVAHKVIRPIKLGEPGVIKPMSVLLNADASRLYVSTGRGHKVFVIDTASNEPVASFDAGQRPWGIALSPDGKMLFTANGPSNYVSIIDVASNTIVKKVKAGTGPWGVITLAE